MNFSQGPWNAAMVVYVHGGGGGGGGGEKQVRCGDGMCLSEECVFVINEGCVSI